jgi:OmpA-OmpF porin, OOP family
MKRFAMLAAAALMLSANALTQTADVVNAGDNEAVSRYQGSFLYDYDEQAYDQFLLILGTWNGPQRAWSDSRTVEGKVTRRAYIAPEGANVLTVYRNFDQAIRGAGLKSVYSCRNAECGPGRTFAVHYFYSMPHRLSPKNHYNPIQGADEFGYIAADGAYRGKKVSFSVAIGLARNVSYRDSARKLIRLKDRVVYYIDSVESAEMATGMVTVSAEQLKAGISRDGQVTLDGIFFDTDKAVIQPESKAALEAIAQYLKSDAGSSFFVVGHTDNTGSYEHNVQLSEARAAAVVTALVVSFGIAASRLQGVGAGPIAPASTNDTEEGRQKNRRVVLVKK